MVIHFKRISVCYLFVVLSNTFKKPFEKIGNSLPICSKKIRIRLNALLVRSKKFGIHPKDCNIHSNG